VHLRYSPWNRATKQSDERCQESECVRLADTLRPKLPAALLPCEINSIFYACVFAFWILYWEQGYQCISSEPVANLLDPAVAPSADERYGLEQFLQSQEQVREE
jgi:hypothetical protein